MDGIENARKYAVGALDVLVDLQQQAMLDALAALDSERPASDSRDRSDTLQGTRNLFDSADGGWGIYGHSPDFAVFILKLEKALLAARSLQASAEAYGAIA